MSTGITPTPDESVEPPATPNWDSWGQVFEDPNAHNPYEIRQNNAWVEALRGESTHERTLEQAMKDWKYLEDGESLEDLQNALSAVRQQRADPFAALNQPPEPDMGEFPEPPEGIDPYTMRQVWQQDQQEAIRQMREEMQNEQRTQQITNNLQNQLERIALKNDFDDVDRAELWNRVQFKINDGQVRPDQLDSLVSTVHKEHEDYVNRLIARRMEGKTDPPPPPSGDGTATPNPVAPVTSFADIASRTMQRIRESEGA